MRTSSVVSGTVLCATVDALVLRQKRLFIIRSISSHLTSIR